MEIRGSIKDFSKINKLCSDVDPVSNPALFKKKAKQFFKRTSKYTKEEEKIYDAAPAHDVYLRICFFSVELESVITGNSLFTNEIYGVRTVSLGCEFGNGAKMDVVITPR